MRRDNCRKFLLHSHQKVKTSAKRPTCWSSNASLHSSNKSAHRLDLPNRIMAHSLVKGNLLPGTPVQISEFGFILLGGPHDGNQDDELGIRPLHNPAQRPCSHESIVQGCPVWTANNCRRHGYDTWSPKQDSIAGETVFKTSTGQKDVEEATASIVANNAPSERRIESVAGVNVDSTSHHFITLGATFKSAWRVVSIATAEFSLRVDAQVTAQSDSTSYKATNTTRIQWWL